MVDAPSREDPDRARDGLPNVDRLLTLSDGVVAIALTLLVLQLSVPHIANPTSASDLANALGQNGDRFISYGVSFYIIGQFWLAHHRVFRAIDRHSEGLAWWNFVFLFTITVMPFTSDLLGAYGSNPLAIDIFGLNLVAASLATQATLIYGHRRHLIVAKVDRTAVRAGRIRTVWVVGVALLSMGLAWVDTGKSKLSWTLIAVGPAVATFWTRRHGGPEPLEGGI